MVLIFYSPFHQEVESIFIPQQSPPQAGLALANGTLIHVTAEKKYLCTGTRFLWLLVEHSCSFPLQFTFCFPATFYL